MRRLRISADIVAPAATVWDLLVDTRRWPEWGPSVRRVETRPRRIGAGSVGRVQTVVGPWLPFEVSSFEEGRSWDWKVAGVAATGHQVVPLGDARCRVTFMVPWIVAPYGVVVMVALRRLRAIAEA
jgi:uncharacterized protein YndB with AHSA1/START domain